MNNKAKKVLNVIADIVLIIIIIIAIVITVLTFSSKSGNKGVANLFGYSPFAVKTDSMNPTFNKGDLVIIKTKDFDSLALKEGEIITFYAKDVQTGEKYINSHRIVKVEDYDDAHNYKLYTTKGDAYQDNDINKVGSTDVIGVYTGTKIAKLGSVMDFLQTQTGFMICVIVPLALFFIWQIYKLISILIENKEQKALAEIENSKNDLSDEEKKRIAEEYLKQQSEKEETETENKN